MILKFFNKNFKINLSLIFLIFICDRISKNYIINQSEKNLGNSILESSYLNITLIWNEGVAFGLFSFDDMFLYHILSLLILTIILVIVYMIAKNSGFKKYSLILVLGGALGNFYDRIINGAVPDFIDFHYNNFHWFVFNLADIFITLGIICLIISDVINKNFNNHEKI